MVEFWQIKKKNFLKMKNTCSAGEHFHSETLRLLRCIYIFNFYKIKLNDQKTFFFFKNFLNKYLHEVLHINFTLVH